MYQISLHPYFIRLICHYTIYSILILLSFFIYAHLLLQFYQISLIVTSFELSLTRMLTCLYKLYAYCFVLTLLVSLWSDFLTKSTYFSYPPDKPFLSLIFHFLTTLFFPFLKTYALVHHVYSIYQLAYPITTSMYLHIFLDFYPFSLLLYEVFDRSEQIHTQLIDCYFKLMIF